MTSGDSHSLSQRDSVIDYSQIQEMKVKEVGSSRKELSAAQREGFPFR